MVGEIITGLVFKAGEKIWENRTDGITNSILLVGMGQVGKTTLIKHLLAPNGADEKLKTTEFKIYRSTKEGDKTHPKTRYVVADYRGQDLGNLFQGLMREHKRWSSPLDANKVNSLILMVDLFGKKEANDPDPIPSENPNFERMEDQASQWPEASISGVFGFATDALHYVCLFINKLDLLTDRSSAKLQKCRDVYKEVITRLQKRAAANPNLTFEVIMGSADTGEGVVRLDQSLLDTAARMRSYSKKG